MDKPDMARGKISSYPAIVMSCDPGTSNFAVCIQEFKTVKSVGRVILSTPILKTISNMNEGVNVKKGWDGYSVQRKRFSQTFDRLIDSYGITQIAAERFQARGLLGSLAEAVSTMNAILAIKADARKLPSSFFVAGEWKNAVRREMNDKEFLRNLYHSANKEYGVSPHAIDACLIGVYSMGVAFTTVMGTKAKNKKFILSLLNN